MINRVRMLSLAGIIAVGMPSLSAVASTENVQAVLSAYEALRGQLARDEIPPALKTAATLERAAKEALPKAPKKMRASLEQLASSAQRLTQASKDDPAAVRRAFGGVSQALVGLLNAEPTLREGRHIFECPMAQGYKKWVQTSEQISNPYMGTQMPRCGSKSTWDQG